MKNLGTLKSNRGHKEVDYLIKISPKEFKMVTNIIRLYRHKYIKGTPLDTNLSEIKRFFLKFKAK